jgi:prolipoprotein diacylglyceryltransferase
MAIVGYGLYRIIFNRIRVTTASWGAFESNSMLAAFGFMFIIQNIALQIWTRSKSRRTTRIPNSPYSPAKRIRELAKQNGVQIPPES